jgi:geranylgeranyl reductase family protein
MRHTVKSSYDVIIVGAGPASATLGHALARKGIEVLILEKEKLPRYKACAGGITAKTAKLLDFDIGPLTQQVIHGVRVVYKGNKEFTKWYNKPLIYMVMRDEFDYFLVRRALEAGATVADNQRVCQLEATANGIEVRTTGDALTAQIIVGADGANSFVVRNLGLEKGIEFGIGMETEISVPGEGLAKWNSLIGLDLGRIRGGYGWIFPKKDHLSVGVGGPLRQAKKLKSCYQKMLTWQQFENYETIRLRSHFLPAITKGAAIQWERGLLLGDAAGLLDPLTGEGVYNAIKSAEIAAPIISQCLRSGTIDLRDYQHTVAKEIVPELKASRSLLRLFTWFPWLYFNLVEGSARLWRASCCLLRGEESYVSLKKRLGALRLIFGLLGIVPSWA